MKVNIKPWPRSALSVLLAVGAVGGDGVVLAQPPDHTGDDPPQRAPDTTRAAAGAVEPPVLLTVPSAQRPAGGHGDEVRVRLQVTIDADGAVTLAEVESGHDPAFDAAAVAAMQQARFSPALRDGVAIPVRFLFDYVFPPLEIADATAEAAGDEHDDAQPAERVGAAVPEGQPFDDTAPALEGREHAQASPGLEGQPRDDASPALEGQPRNDEFGADAVVRSPANVRRHSVEAVDVVELGDAHTRTADLGEVLARAEGVSVRRSGGLGSAERISLAGLEGQQLRYFLDGVPLRYMGFATGLANIPVGLVERVEIYRGVVPIRYGADAIGGAIDLVTDRTSAHDHATLSYQGGSFDTHRLSANAHVRSARTGLFARGAAYLDSARNDYDVDVQVAGPSGRREPRSVSVWNANYRAQGAALELGVADRPRAGRASLRAFVTDHRRGIPHNLGMTVPYGDVRYGQTDTGALARYEHTFVDERLSVDLALGYVAHRVRFVDEGSCRYNWLGTCVRTLDPPGELVTGGRNLATLERSVYARANVAFQLADGHTVQLSASPEFDQRQTDRDSVGASTLTGRGSRRMIVLGAAYDASWGERLAHSVFAKVYTQRLTADEHVFGEVQTHEVDERALGVGDSLRVELSDALTLKASYEWATRMPSSNEYFGDGALTLYNYGLTPERSHNVNLALRADLRSDRLGGLTGELALFARVVRDLIWQSASADSFQYQNIGESRSLGATLNVSYRSPGDWLAIRGTASYLDARNLSRSGAFADVRGDRLPNRPYLEGAGEVELGVNGLVRDRDRLTAVWGFRYTHAFYLAYESRGTSGAQLTIPAQLVMHAALRYVASYGARTLSTVIEAQNLTDTAVYDFFGVQRPGRAVYAKLVIDF
ncbi:MAG: TonB-dependent receptor [Polyangiales bacterium]